MEVSSIMDGRQVIFVLFLLKIEQCLNLLLSKFELVVDGLFLLLYYSLPLGDMPSYGTFRFLHRHLDNLEDIIVVFDMLF